MKTETKFNLGQKIYYITKNDIKKTKITGIEIYLVKAGRRIEKDCWYYVEDSCCKREEELFATKKEAQKEWNKRNGK